MERITIGRIPVNLMSEEMLHFEIEKIIANNSRKTILHSNANLVQLANSSDKWLLKYFSEDVDFIMCDGSGVQLAALITNQKIPQKIAYNIWFWKFAKFCNTNKFSIFLLGGKPEVVEKAAENLKTRNEGLQVFFHHGYFNKQVSSIENQQVIDMINRIKPNILLVCFGMPIQEKYVKEHIDSFNINIAMTGGGALDFFAGNSRVAPIFFRKIYLEWFYRLCLEPRRLFKRYIIGNFKFLYYIFKYRRSE